jgi:hypothetical protein
MDREHCLVEAYMILLFSVLTMRVNEFVRPLLVHNLTTFRLDFRFRLDHDFLANVPLLSVPKEKLLS